MLCKEQMVSHRRSTTFSNVAKTSLRNPRFRISFQICSMGFISGVYGGMWKRIMFSGNCRPPDWCHAAPSQQSNMMSSEYRSDNSFQKDVHAHCIAIRHDKKASLTGQRLYRSVGIAILSDMVTGYAGAYPFLTPAVFRPVYPSKSSLILKHQADFLSAVDNFQIFYRGFNFFEAAISSRTCSIAFISSSLNLYLEAIFITQIYSISLYLFEVFY